MTEPDELPDAADVRAVLREHGQPVNERGRLSAAERIAYEAIRTPEPAGEYDGGVTAADFPPDEPEPPASEKKPRRVRQAKPATSSWRDRLQGKPKTGKPKKYARVPVDRLIERGWEMLARLAGPVSPSISVCMELQAPVAGLIMEDVIRDTMVDRALQPVARAEEKAEKVIALVGPPVLVGAIQAAQGITDERERAMRLAILVPMLRESMVLWVKIAGDKIEEKARRDQEMGPVNEQVDRLLALIFPPPPVAEMVADDEMAGV